jgi:dihydrofolate synthase/folylpolyglutamate synthase
VENSLLTTKFEHFDLEDWLNYFEKTVGDNIRLGLDNIRAVAERLELLNPDYHVITVAGTNGKGSTVAALESIYKHAGYKTAVYTSPHLLRINERIKCHGQEISDKDFCDAFAIVQGASQDIALTFFETLTLAALCFFKKMKPEIAILEVGLGGRLDATNIIDAELAIISAIDYDHQEILGDSLEEIAFEKAGILRDNQQAIFADMPLPEVIQKIAKEKSVSLYSLGKEYQIIDEQSHWDLKVHVNNQIFSHLPISSISRKAQASAILAVQLLKDKLPVSEQQIKKGLIELYVPGRLDYIPGKVSKLFDVAHNPHAAYFLAEYLNQLPLSGRVHAIFSALKDKDLIGLIQPVKAHVDFWYPVVLDVKRAADKQSIETAFHALDIDVSCDDSPLEAYNRVLQAVRPGDLILIYGSFYIVSQIMEIKSDLPDDKERK